MNLVLKDVNGNNHNISCVPSSDNSPNYIGYTSYSSNSFDITGNRNIKVKGLILINNSSEVFTVNENQVLVKLGEIVP